jgi:Glycosyl hydrolase catalytic core
VHRARRARLIGFTLVGLGLVLILFTWSSGRWPWSQGEGSPSPEVSDPTALSPLPPPPTRTPEPVVPTRTPVLAGEAISPLSAGGVAISPLPPVSPLAPATVPGRAVTGTVGAVVGQPTEAVTGTVVAVVGQPTQAVTGTVVAVVGQPTEAVTGTIVAVVGQSGDLWRGHPRWGVSMAVGAAALYDLPPLHLGWYMDWLAQPAAPGPGGSEYVPMARVRGGVLDPDAQSLADMARARPGMIWLIGNEPDVKWQDNVDAATYARLYHEAYTAIKGADSTAQVSIGSISEPTPLRLRYLDAVLASYKEQFVVPAPVEVWNIHNYMLREERGSWGVDVPPGMADQRGKLYQIDDSANLTVFKQQIVDFRRWMADHDYRDRPLLITEFGIPMPVDYGFPAERVIAFWTGAFDYFRTASDPALGVPADQNRLVQAWWWFSLADSDYTTGNVFDPQTRAITQLGQAWAAYAGRIR